MLSCTTRRSLLGLVLLGTAATPSFAQTNTTALTGTVTDSAGLRLPGSTVTLLNAATGTRDSFDTRNQGEFNFPQVVPGHYTVTIHHEGFADQVQNLELLIATPRALNVQLSVGGGKETVTIEADLPTSLNQVDASLGKAFNELQIQNLPYLANNTLSLLALQPGVVAFDASNTTDTRAGAINGARQDQTNITLDGVDNNDANFGYAFTGVLRTTRDSIDEFRVTTSGANADSGRSSGAQVALQTKSGSNHVHGSAYYYYRNPGASNQWFNKQAQLNSSQLNRPAKILQDTFGGTLGLPILHDRLFFFGAYEGYKQSSSSVVTRTVPLGLRNGTVSYLNTTGGVTTLTPAQIASMDKGCRATGACPNGPGVDAAAVAYFNLYPTANAVAGDGYNTGGYTFASPAPVSNITNIARVDYNLTQNQHLFLRGNLQGDNTLDTLQFPGGVPVSNSYGNNRGLAGSHIWSINDHLINNFRYGWTRFGNARKGGVSSDYVTFAALSALTPTTSSTILLENTHNLADDFTITKGRHTIQVGANDRLVYNQRTLTNTLYKNANVTQSYLDVGSIANQHTNLDPQDSNLPKVASSFNTSYDQAITAATGLITYASQYVNYGVSGTSLTPLAAGTVPTRTFRNFEQEYYAQDQFRITPKLTLTAGLRYSYLGVPFETNGQQVRPTTSLSDFLDARVAGMQVGTSYNARIAVAPGGKANGAKDFWTAQTKNFAPRLAFNYSPDGKTSVRGGFMLAYDHFGQGAVNVYNDSYSFGLSSQYASSVGTSNVNTAPRFTSATAVPTSITPTPSAGGSFPVTNTGGLGYITQSFDDKLRTPYSEVFDVSVQREVHKGLTLTGTFVGRLGRHLLMSRDVAMPLNLSDAASGQTYFGAMTQLDQLYDAGRSIGSVPNIAYWQDMFPNASFTTGGVTYRGTQAVYGRLSRGNETATLYTLDGGTTASPAGQSYRFFHPQFSSLYAQSSIGSSNYNGLQLSLRHTVNRSFVYDFNYTLSKALDMGSSPERGTSLTALTTSSAPNTVINTFNPSQMYGVADFDARHAINADWTIAVPFGHGQRFGAASGRWMDELLGGWTLAGLTKWNSGLPFSSVGNVGWGTNWNNRSYNVQTAPITNTGHHTYIPSSTGVITVSAFQDGAANAFSKVRQAYVGETGQRNKFRGDGYFSVDPSVSKSFRTFESQSFRLTVDVFNALNSIRFSTPATGSAAPTSNFGRYSTLLNSPRQIQFSGRYYF